MNFERLIYPCSRLRIIEKCGDVQCFFEKIKTFFDLWCM